MALGYVEQPPGHLGGGPRPGACSSVNAEFTVVHSARLLTRSAPASGNNDASSAQDARRPDLPSAIVAATTP